MLLRTVEKFCLTCGRQTREKVLASRLIQMLPENQAFGGNLRIVQCQECGLRYLNPMPHPHDLSQIYSYDVYADSTNSNPVLQHHFYALLAKYCWPIRRVLEIGCGTGEFLAFLESKGIKVTGVEFADSAQRVKFKGRLYVSRMEDLEIPSVSFDAVLLLNVIEHLADPVEVLKKISKMLTPEGVLLLRHPNSDLFFSKPYLYLIEYPKYLLHRWLLWHNKKTRFTLVGFQNQHLYYFNRSSVSRMLADAGLEVKYFSTVDPYNRSRISHGFKKGRLIEACVATLRHIMGFIGLGPECLIVAVLEKPHTSFQDQAIR